MTTHYRFRTNGSDLHPLGNAHARCLAWEKWVVKNGPYDYYVTLNFNQEETIASARQKISRLFARVDSDMLGRSWSRQLDRTFAIGVFEHPQTNLHSHALWRLPSLVNDQRLRVSPSRIEAHWKRLTFYRGSVDVQSIYDLPGVVNYMAKELHHDAQLENFYTASEFHRH